MGKTPKVLPSDLGSPAVEKVPVSLKKVSALGEGGGVLIETLADIKLIGRAMRQGWNVPEEKKHHIVDRLLELVDSPDDKIAIAAADKLMKADLLQQRVQGADEDRRLRMVEQLKRIPAGELARLASTNGILLEGTAERVVGRADEPAGTDGEEAGR